MHIKFHGAAGTVTGSCFLLSGDNQKILIDMGMFQGSHELEDMNFHPLKFNPEELDFVFLTHAHLDHVGRMPLLIKHGYKGTIYMTAATREIAEVVLLDAAKIMQKDEDKLVLYTKEHVFNLLNQVKVVSYGEKIDFGGNRAIFRDAGHILGSASIEMKFEGKKFAFSGDLGNTPEDLVKPTEYIKEANIALLESTYGDRNHPKQDTNELLLSEINAVEESGGALLIPSFSVERTQAILHKISHLKKKGWIKPQTPFYLDSPMGETVTEIYKRYGELLNSELKDDFMKGDPFVFPGLRIIESYEESRAIRNMPGPKVIIAGSGMINGGRILEHAAHFLPIKSTRILIVGFQGENTIGRQIEEGARRVNIYGEDVSVEATVTTIHSMSAHADQEKLIKWLDNIEGVKKVFLVHGEDGGRGALKDKIKREGLEVYLPNLDEVVGL